jgi:hypothetical protein
MEAFLLSFFRRQVVGPMPRALDHKFAARKRKREGAAIASPTLVSIKDIVEPQTSFFDIAWAVSCTQAHKIPLH